MSFKCKTCGEGGGKSGNFLVKVLPAKRIPKKAKKLMKTMANLDEGNHPSSIETNSFQKFLMKRIKPVNFLELTCGKCGTISKIKMYKNPGPKEEVKAEPKKMKESERSLMSPTLALSSRKGKKKRDLTAGLTLCMDASKGPVSTEGNQASASNQRKRSFQKQKEMDNLKKILFHSKKAKTSGSSLQDFLSGI